MGIKDNFTQAMKELTNPRPSDARKEVRDVASYMNDTADAQPTEPVQAVQNTQPSENEQPEQQAQQSVNPETAGNGFAQQEQAQDFSQRIARDMNENTLRATRLIRMYAATLLRRHLRTTDSQAAGTDLHRAVQTMAATILL